MNNEWISVYDQLPDHHVSVNICYKGELKDDWIAGVGHHESTPECDQWWAFETDGNVPCTVCLWAHVPDLPLTYTYGIRRMSNNEEGEGD